MNTTSRPAVISADFTIIGNGALGLFLANEIKTRNQGKTVIVVGPRDRSSGASQAAGAMLGCFAEATADTLRTPEGKKRFEIGVEAHKMWDSVLETLQAVVGPEHPLKMSADTHVILNSIGHTLDSDNFSAIINALNTYQQPWSEVDPNTIAGFKPRPDCRAFNCIRLHEEGAVDARGVLSALEALLLQKDVLLLDQSVRKILSSNGKVTGVVLEDGTSVETPICVVAAGARSEVLARSAFEDIDLMPTFPGLGLGMIARRTRGDCFNTVVRTPNRGFGCGLHVVPQGNGREYLGATNRVMHEVTNATCVGDFRFLSKYSMQQLDEGMAHHQVEQWLRGNRPITLDGFPMIGWLPHAGLYLMTGTFRDGFHASPYLAVHVANELEGRPGVIDPIIVPTRKAIFTRTTDASIEDFVQHSIGTWYEVGTETPEMPMPVLEGYFRDKARRLYDELSVDVGLSPEVLEYVNSSEAGKRHIRAYLNAA